jgi:phosphoribosylformylglycinamidine synthase
VVVETTDPDAVRAVVPESVPVAKLGESDDSGSVSFDVDGDAVTLGADRVAELRDRIGDALE